MPALGAYWTPPWRGASIASRRRCSPRTWPRTGSCAPWPEADVRTGPKVQRSRYDELGRTALDARRGEAAREIADNVPKTPIDAKFQRFEPVQQVAARLELAGPERLVPRVRAGLDVRGDGSTEAYVGRIRREVVKQRKGENAYKALRRELAAPVRPSGGQR